MIVLATIAVFAALPGTASAIVVPPCTITGTPNNDVLVGTMGPDVICGLGGDDVIWGRAGNDYLRAGDNHDLLHGERGADWVRGYKITGDRGNDRLNSRDGYLGYAFGGPGVDLCVIGVLDSRSSCRVVDHFRAIRPPA